MPARHGSSPNSGTLGIILERTARLVERSDTTSALCKRAFVEIQGCECVGVCNSTGVLVNGCDCRSGRKRKSYVGGGAPVATPDSCDCRAGTNVDVALESVQLPDSAFKVDGSTGIRYAGVHQPGHISG